MAARGAKLVRASAARLETPRLPWARANRTPASELLVGQRQYRLAAECDGARQRGCLRQQAFGVEPRGGDLAAIKSRVAFVFRKQARRDLCASRELPAPRDQAPQPQVWHRSRMRGAGCFAVRGNHPVDRILQRGGKVRTSVVPNRKRREPERNPGMAAALLVRG